MTAVLSTAVPLVEIHRGDFLESLHRGHAVICDAAGEVVESWGDPELVMLPRSSSKMIQALPLITSGAADARGLTPRQLALACASHNGAHIHTEAVGAWLKDLGKTDDDFRCGPQEPADRAARDALIRAGEAPCQIHNNCSGKHAGFLTLADHLGAGPEYIDPDHPVQVAVREAHQVVTGADVKGFAIDGCSAPNFATTLYGLARAMAWYASAGDRSDSASRAGQRLAQAMAAHPEMVAGEGRACTRLMRAMDGVAVKTGAEAVFVGILPEQRLGIAVKIADGGTRAAECVIAALLVKCGALDPAHPEAKAFIDAPIANRRGIVTGTLRPVDSLR